MIKLRTLKQLGGSFSSLALVLFFFTGMQQLIGQSITEFDSKKPIKVADATGQPTIQRALPFKIVDGDNITEGTGTIELNWTNISDKKDIAVYNEAGNLLNYYFEVFDATDKVAVIWVYNDWKRDGTAQAQIGFGNGPSDQSASKATVFGNESNLVAGYLLNESSGDALDVTGNNDGTVYGATQGQAGQVGYAYDFDGINDYVEVPDDNSLNPTEAITISAWIYIESLPNDWPRIVTKGWTDSYDLYYRKNDNCMSFSLWGTNAEHLHGNKSLDFNEWHLVTATYDRNEMRIYVDGQLDASTSKTDKIPTTTNKLRIGDGEGEIRNWDGKIDDIRIYDHALNSDEITAYYGATKASPDLFYQMAAMDSDEEEILPVQLLSFRATCLEGNRAEISWSTATELNNQQFEVQLSANGQHFETVRTVPGTGNSNEVITYETLINISDDHGYVRLKQMDFDGQTETFNPVELVCKEQNKPISIFPNPVTDNLNIDLSGYSQSDMKIQVLNIMGKVVHATEVQSGTQQVQINLEALPPGMYMVRIQNNNGEQTLKRITK